MGNSCSSEPLPPLSPRSIAPSNPSSVPAHYYQYSQSLRGGARTTDINHWKTRLDNGIIPMVLTLKVRYSYFLWTKYPDKVFEYQSKYKVKLGLLQTEYKGTLISNFGDYTSIYFEKYTQGIRFFVALRKFIDSLRPLTRNGPVSYFFDTNAAFSIGLFEHSKPISENYRYCYGSNVISALSQCGLYPVSFTVDTPNSDVNKQIQNHVLRMLSFIPFEVYTFDIPESVTEEIFELLNKHCKHKVVALTNTNNGPERTRTGYRYVK